MFCEHSDIMDSAGGSAKQGRDKMTQAILPLRGKILNLEKADLARIQNNQEVKSIIQSLGCGVGDNFDINKINYHKIVLMTDADSDGKHIMTLILTLFYNLYPQLIKNGYIYVANPPLFKVEHGKVIKYYYNEEDKNKYVDGLDKKGTQYRVQRYKGLGEMNSDQLWETTMDPKTRTLHRVTMKDARKAKNTINMLMGNGIDDRRTYLIKNARKVDVTEL